MAITHSRGLLANVQPARVADLTSRLVRCDTSNPPGDERPVAPLLVDTLESIGCEVQVLGPDEQRPSILARYRGAGAKTLAINGHLDVVSAVREAWKEDPFGGRISDEKVFGRGACDTKGGIAAAIEALRVLRDSAVTAACDIELQLVADEEAGGQCGAEWLVGMGYLDADACVVLEPTGLNIGVAERGTLLASIEVLGRGGHGSEPASGDSAVAGAARIVSALHLRNFGDRTHPYLGSPTCNVGTIQGGTAPNIIADFCAVTIDRRVLPGKTEAEVLDEIGAIIDALEPPINYRIEPLAFVESSEISDEDPFVRTCWHLIREIVPGASLFGSSLGSDARIMRNKLRVPTVVFGPGSPLRAHSSDEWVAIDDLTNAARALVTLFTSFGSA